MSRQKWKRFQTFALFPTWCYRDRQPSPTLLNCRPILVHYHPFLSTLADVCPCLVNSRLFSPILMNSRPLSSTFIHPRQLSSTLDHFRPLSSSLIHPHQISSILTHSCRLLPILVNFRTLSSTFVHPRQLSFILVHSCQPIVHSHPPRQLSSIFIHLGNSRPIALTLASSYANCCQFLMILVICRPLSSTLLHS